MKDPAKRYLVQLSLPQDHQLSSLRREPVGLFIFNLYKISSARKLMEIWAEGNVLYSRSDLRRGSLEFSAQYTGLHNSVNTR